MFAAPSFAHHVTSIGGNQEQSLYLTGKTAIAAAPVWLLVHPAFRSLTDDEPALLREVILRDLEVEGRGSLPYTAGDVVVRTVAGAEPATKVTGFANGHTTQMGADTYKSVRCQQGRIRPPKILWSR